MELRIAEAESWCLPVHSRGMLGGVRTKQPHNPIDLMLDNDDDYIVIHFETTRESVNIPDKPAVVYDKQQIAVLCSISKDIVVDLGGYLLFLYPLCSRV